MPLPHPMAISSQANQASFTVRDPTTTVAISDTQKKQIHPVLQSLSPMTVNLQSQAHQMSSIFQKVCLQR